MAKGGSGDVLSGILTSFVSQKSNDISTVALGNYVFSSAGEEASKDINELSLLPSDICSYLIKVLNQILLDK